MADNVELNSGSGGATLATDDISGTHHQRVKIQHGADGSATDVSSASPLPVTLPTGAATAANQSTANTALSAIQTAVETLDNIVSGSEAQVDVVTSALPTGAATSANQSTANTALSAIQTAVETLDNIVSGNEAQVDIVASLPAGTNAIGKLAANDGVDIGDVDVMSISAGANLIGDVGLSGARTSGGTTIYRNLDVDESEDEVKGSAGQIYWIHAINLTSSTLYLKFYNATAASVTVGTTTPALTYPVPTPGDSNGAGFNFSVPNGIAFGTAITVACTTALADADAGAPSTNACVLNLGYA